MTHKATKDLIESTVSSLDVLYKDKGYNFFHRDAFDDEVVLFYNRDLCKDISFKETIEWLLQYAGSEGAGLEDLNEIHEFQNAAIMYWLKLFDLYAECKIKGYRVE